MLRAVVLTQYRRVTDGQTDGIAIASTVLAMRALRRAVKMEKSLYGSTENWGAPQFDCLERSDR